MTKDICSQSDRRKYAYPQDYANGGMVKVGTPARKGGVGQNPITRLKRVDGVPGMKAGGKVC